MIDYEISLSHELLLTFVPLMPDLVSTWYTVGTQ